MTTGTTGTTGNTESEDGNMGMTREEMLAVLEKRYGNREPQRQEPTLAEIADMTTWEQQTYGTTEDHELAVQGL